MDHKALTTKLASFSHRRRHATESPPATTPSRSCSNEIDLDLIDVMLDLDPGALVWSPQRQDATFQIAEE